MKREYNIPQTEVVCPNMQLMAGAESIKSAVGNPGSVDESMGCAPARKLYL